MKSQIGKFISKISYIAIVVISMITLALPSYSATPISTPSENSRGIYVKMDVEQDELWQFKWASGLAGDCYVNSVEEDDLPFGGIPGVGKGDDEGTYYGTHGGIIKKDGSLSNAVSCSGDEGSPCGPIKYSFRSMKCKESGKCTLGSYSPSGDILCGFDGKWYLCDSSFYKKYFHDGNLGYYCNEQGEWKNVEICDNGKDDDKDDKIDCLDDNCYGTNKALITEPDQAKIGEHELDYTSTKVYFHQSCNPDADKTTTPNSEKVCKATSIPAPTGQTATTKKAYAYYATQFQDTGSNQCCGDDKADCGKVMTSSATSQVLCNIGKEDAIFSKWLRSDGAADATGAGLGNINLVKCSATEYLSKGDKWVKCDGEFEGNVNSDKKIMKVGSHEYLCQGKGATSIVECCGDDLNNCQSKDSSSGRRIRTGDPIDTSNFVNSTDPNLCGNGNVNTGERCGEPGLSTCTSPKICSGCVCVDPSTCAPPKKLCTSGCIEPACSESKPCSGGQICENPGNCEATCKPRNTCGDGSCPNPRSIEENCGNCPVDCGVCPGDRDRDGMGDMYVIASDFITGNVVSITGYETATDTGTTYRCMGDGTFVKDLDNLPPPPGGGSPKDTCEQAGYTWTGSKCCGEPEDSPEYYNDASVDGGGGGAGKCSKGEPQITGASNGAEYCDDEGFTYSGSVILRCLSSQGTAFITNQQPPAMADGVNRCQAYGNFGNNPPFTTVAKINCASQKEVEAAVSGANWAGIYGPTGNFELCKKPTTGGTGNVVKGVTGYAIDAGNVQWIDANVGGWQQTATLSVELKSDQICLNYDKANSWSEMEGVVANAWIIVNKNGRWYASTWEWMRPGQTCKDLSNLVEPGAMRGELREYTVKTGETYGFMVSGLARDSRRNAQERSNIAEVTWTGTVTGTGRASDTTGGAPGGCWNSKPVMSVSFVDGTVNSVLNYQGQFYGCALENTNYNKDNDNLLDLKDSSTDGTLVINRNYCALTPDESFYCSYTEKWIETNGADKSHLSTAPFLAGQKSECCAASECWDGKSCIEDQSSKPLDKIYGDGYRCISGSWIKMQMKCSPDGDKCGYCSDDKQCMVNPLATGSANQCINSGEYDGDDYCDNGEWSTRTKLLTLKLLKMKSGDYTLFCDDKENTLNNLQYLTSSGEAAGNIISNMQANNFCVLKSRDAIIVATSVNKPPESVSGGFSVFGITGCNSAKDDGNYYACDPSRKVWYNKRLKSFIQSDAPIAVPLDQEPSSYLANMIKGIIDSIKRLIQDPPFDESYVNSIKRFDKIFLMQHGSSYVRGAIEGKAMKNMVIEYHSFGVNLCSYIGEFNSAGNFESSGISCRNEGSDYYALGQGSELTNFDPESVWPDLTSKLRLR